MSVAEIFLLHKSPSNGGSYEPLTCVIEAPPNYDKLLHVDEELSPCSSSTAVTEAISSSASLAASTDSALRDHCPTGSGVPGPQLNTDSDSVQNLYDVLTDSSNVDPTSSATTGSAATSFGSGQTRSPPAAVPLSPLPTNPPDLPNDVSGLTVNQVSECLRQLHLDEFVDAFQRHDVDGQLLTILDEDMLTKDFAMSRFQAMKLLKFIHEGWRPRRTPRNA